MNPHLHRPEFRKAGRRLEVQCPSGHPLLQDLATRKYNWEESTGLWWRAFSDAEQEWIRGAIAAHAVSYATPFANGRLGEGARFPVEGNTYPIREQLANLGCRRIRGVWMAPTAEAQKKALALVADQGPAAPARFDSPPPWKEPELPTGSKRFAFFISGRFCPFKKGEDVTFDGRKFRVTAAAVKFGVAGVPNECWAHLLPLD